MDNAHSELHRAGHLFTTVQQVRIGSSSLERWAYLRRIDNSKRTRSPHVALPAIASIPANEFGGGVAGCPAYSKHGPLEIVRRHESRQTKIAQLQSRKGLRRIRRFSEQAVVRLNVAMNNSTAVQVRKSTDDVSRHTSAIILSKPAERPNRMKCRIAGRRERQQAYH